MFMTRRDIIERSKKKAENHLILLGCGIETEKNSQAYQQYMLFISQLEETEKSRAQQ